MTDQRADTPRTKAGRDLLGGEADALWTSLDRRTMRDFILAIEAEAAAEPAAAEPPDMTAAERNALIEKLAKDGSL